MIDFNVQYASNLNITLYDINGRFINTISKAAYEPGNYNILLDASDYASGIYFVQFSSNDLIKTEKITLIK